MDSDLENASEAYEGCSLLKVSEFYKQASEDKKHALQQLALHLHIALQSKLDYLIKKYNINKYKVIARFISELKNEKEATKGLPPELSPKSTYTQVSDKFRSVTGFLGRRSTPAYTLQANNQSPEL
jgi:hypothetical protein